MLDNPPSIYIVQPDRDGTQTVHMHQFCCIPMYIGIAVGSSTLSARYLTCCCAHNQLSAAYIYRHDTITSDCLALKPDILLLWPMVSCVLRTALHMHR